MRKIDWSVVFDMNKNKLIVTVDRPDGNRNLVRNIEAQQLLFKSAIVNETHMEKISIEIFNSLTFPCAAYLTIIHRKRNEC